MKLTLLIAALVLPLCATSTTVAADDEFLRPPTTVRGALLAQYTDTSTDAIRKLYQKRDFEPLWFKHPDAAQQWLNQLSEKHLPGVESSLSGASQLDAGHLLTTQNDHILIENELKLTEAFFAYAEHLSKYMPTFNGNPAVNIGDLLERSVKSESLDHAFSLLMPPHEQYYLLLQKLGEYETIATQGGWPEISFGRKIFPLKYDNRIPTIRQRLAISGDLDNANVNNSQFYDAAMVDAVSKFQRRQGLTVDGIIKRSTIRKMNISVDYRIKQIQANLTRWHDLPIDLGQKHLLVNIPDYTLSVIKGPRTLMKVPVIVGKRDRKTPILHDELEKLVINPQWNVPHRIAINDILPEARANPQALVDKKIRVLKGWGHDFQDLSPLEVNWADVSKHKFPYRFRQEPGPRNAMGEIKFLFPNGHNVYVHGTPAKSLFAKANRTFSSGCIRIENPVGLAAVLLDETRQLNYDDIESIVDSGKTEEIWLEEPWQVHLVYWTAWVDEKSGELNFRRDIYRKDK